MWIERDLVSGTYSFDPALEVVWNSAESARDEKLAGAKRAAAATSPGDTSDGSADATAAANPTRNDLLAGMRNYWPHFLYFDSFQDMLPRTVDVEALLADPQDERRKGIPEAVLDFIALADINVARVKELETQDKALGNYLQNRAAAITGDFLSYWHQQVDGRQQVNLHVRHIRNAAGVLKLSFYVRDEQIEQYPEQRSKGFVWFLSFFLRLTAAQRRHPERTHLLLIDEPGSYLHARAQRDVLALFEKRLAQVDTILYSSHSLYLMPPERLHRLRVVVKSGVNGSRVYDRLTHPDLAGPESVDTLTPIIQAIGIDITQTLSFARPRNVVVEGITDFIYLTAWSKQFSSPFLEQVNVFPGSGASTVLVLASLMIGWGLEFVVLLDRDSIGESTAKRLRTTLALSDTQIVQYTGAVAIEDVFAPVDFTALVKRLDARAEVKQSETPSKAIARLKLDKVLIARAYAEGVAAGDLRISDETRGRVVVLLNDILKRFG